MKQWLGNEANGGKSFRLEGIHSKGRKKKDAKPDLKIPGLDTVTYRSSIYKYLYYKTLSVHSDELETNFFLGNWSVAFCLLCAENIAQFLSRITGPAWYSTFMWNEYYGYNRLGPCSNISIFCILHHCPSPLTRTVGYITLLIVYGLFVTHTPTKVIAFVQPSS